MIFVDLKKTVENFVM